jgi:hypothetical protein
MGMSLSTSTTADIRSSPGVTSHITEFSKHGWLVIHPVGCRGDLMKCPVTQLVRDLGKSPRLGRYEAWAERGRVDWKLVLGDDEVPWEIQGSARRIGHCWDTRPPAGGIPFPGSMAPSHG